MTVQEAKTKLYRYCAYQERCHQEVDQKLRELGLRGDAADEVIHHLILEGFLSEERFAKNFVSGKFRLKHWGRLKIVRELEQRNVSTHCIRAGLREIDEGEYALTLGELLKRKADNTEAENVFTLRDKVSRFAIQKGFEPELVWMLLKQQIPDR
jgi:regulatory protein